MSRSGLPATIFLELKDLDTGKLAALGSDAIMHVDGRWSYETAAAKAYAKSADIRARSGRLLVLAGYTVPASQGGSRDYPLRRL